MFTLDLGLFETLNLLQKLCYVTLAGCGTSFYLKFKRGKKNRIATGKIGKKNILKEYEGDDGLRIGKEIYLSRNTDMKMVGVFGPTGSNKSVSLSIANLLENRIKGSIIVNDNKGEIYYYTHKYQEDIGRNIILYRPLAGDINFDPLGFCINDQEVIQLAQNMLINGNLTFETATNSKSSGPEWLEMSQSLLTAVLLYYKHKKKGSLKAATRFLITSTSEEIDMELMSSGDSKVLEYYKIFLSCVGSDGTVASILITLRSRLQLYLDDNLKINFNNFNIEDLRKKPTVLYIQYPQTKGKYLSPLLAVIYSQIMNRLVENYSSRMLDVHYFLDEFANLGHIQDFEERISYDRHYGISYLIFLQGYSQLVQKYGVHNAMTIWGNLNSKIFLPGIHEPELLKMVNLLVGEEQIRIPKEKGNITTTKKSTLTPDEVRRTKDDELLYLFKNKYPIIEKQNIYFKNDEYLGKYPERRFDE